MRYELISCALHGHELLGTDSAELRPQDHIFARDYDGLRWYRCLRCDAWVDLPPPSQPRRRHPPEPDEVVPPLRGRALRDRYVLRLIAIDRALRIIVLAPVAAAIFLFAENRAQLHRDYTKVLAALQTGFGGPINDFATSALSRIFALSTTKLYLAGVILSVYAALLLAEAVGLWATRRWAEYLTFCETGAFVPFETYELFQTISTLKVLALVINLAVLSYLLVRKRLFGIRGGGRAEREEREADNGWRALEAVEPSFYEAPEPAPREETGRIP